MRERDELPSYDLLFVGHDDGGGAILLVLAGEHHGEVWLLTEWIEIALDHCPRATTGGV